MTPLNEREFGGARVTELQVGAYSLTAEQLGTAVALARCNRDSVYSHPDNHWHSSTGRAFKALCSGWLFA